MDDGMGWWMALGSLWFVIFWAIVIWAIVRVTERSDRRQDTGESAIDILRRRYARGEIDKEQFDQMRHDLGA
ncbi:MAG TPA: SHOCT domain-containing protein [Dehalococcoidia bacterium]|nr:SHOCT domain-containing protein [Dehalococcoidia bacterium]